MSTKVERLEHNMAKLTVEVPAEEFEKAMTYAYNKNKGRINLQGFRKGKAPRALIEKMYGPEIFFEDAANYAIQNSYEDAVKESELTLVSRPDVDIVQIGKGQSMIYTAEVAVRPEVTLGEYKGLEVPKAELSVTDEEVEKELGKELEKNARVIDVDDRPAQMGDTVVLDFDGSVDGVPFDGGKSENYTLELGSGSFIPGFEEQLAGKSIDEECEVNVRFPDDYHAEELKGKEAVFKCLIHSISHKEVPAADDEFAKDVSEFDTLEEYKEDLRKNLLADKEKAARQAKENAAVAKLIDVMEADIPEAMIETDVDNMERDYENRLSQSGLDLATYLKYMNMTRDEFRKNIRPQVETQIKTRLALEKVVELENISIPDDKFEEEINKTAESYGMKAEQLKGVMDEESEKQMRLDMAVQEAITFVTDNAVEVEAQPEAAEDTEAAEKEE